MILMYSTKFISFPFVFIYVINKAVCQSPESSSLFLKTKHQLIMLHLSSICKNQLLSGTRTKILHVLDISAAQCDKMWEVLSDADNETEPERVVLGCNHRCIVT
jgi:hypothetical protein